MEASQDTTPSPPRPYFWARQGEGCGGGTCAGLSFLVSMATAAPHLAQNRGARVGCREWAQLLPAEPLPGWSDARDTDRPPPFTPGAAAGPEPPSTPRLLLFLSLLSLLFSIHCLQPVSLLSFFALAGWRSGPSLASRVLAGGGGWDWDWAIAVGEPGCPRVLPALSAECLHLPWAQTCAAWEVRTALPLPRVSAQGARILGKSRRFLLPLEFGQKACRGWGNPRPLHSGFV